MFQEKPSLAANVAERYQELSEAFQGLLAGERDPIANMANMAALLFNSLDGLNWAGFYRRVDDGLVLGPFQGKPACVRIAVGRGVCGTAVAEKQTILVPDVHEFPGHIACDAASRSELVVPMIRAGHVIGVLDLDSPHKDRFCADDALGCERLVSLLVAGSDF